MEVHGTECIPHRRFAQADLAAIDAILRDGPFDDLEWEVTDRLGTTRGPDLPPILRNVLWESVQKFAVSATRYSRSRDGDADLLSPSNHLYLWLTTTLNVAWSAAPENRQPVELAFSRLIHLLTQLPVNRGYNSRFTDMPEPEPPPKPQPHWWNPIRAPRSIIDWLVIGIAVAIIAAGLIALLAQLP